MDFLNGSSAVENATKLTGSANFAGTILKNSYGSCLSSNNSMQMSSSLFSSHDLWILDSGASDHICHDPGLLQNLTPIPIPFYITLPTGNTVKVSHTDRVSIASNFYLTGVLFVPNFCQNLLSIRKLVKQKYCKIIFTTDLCLMQDLSVKMPLVLGRLHKGIYLFHGQDFKNVLSFPLKSEIDLIFVSPNGDFVSKTCVSISKPSTSIMTWHCRLGHLPLYKLQQLLQVHCSDKLSVDYCSNCHQARQHKKPFPHSYIHTSSTFELIHIDLWGAYHTPTHKGHKYFLTIVDDYSRATWTHLIVQKVMHY